ncbi:tRNA(fMet)-specific endonuclease VapC [Pseudescherichia sp.]|uniref:tRNA(fMet)-specific endonuclease VapC n=1 Tax=Pseudescherichia sp. TaxID=2055881 RepID=UPI0028AFE66F|nr:tRNA(fMet)-specific endonuclease VapC [Pseudescherichia sp.]
MCIINVFNREAFKQHYGRMCVTSVTLMELIYGAEKSASPEKNLRVVEGFIARLEVLNYCIDAAVQTGQIRAELARAGTPIGPYDSMIAAHARTLGLILMTNNTRELEHINGLRLEDWSIG